MNLRTTAVCVLLAGLVMVPLAGAQGRPGAPSQRDDAVEPPSEQQWRRMLEDAGIEKIDDSTYRIGKVTLSTEERTVRFPATVKVDVADQIELVTCVPEGKTYETMTVTEAEALNIQLALLLLGMEPGKNPAIDYPPDDPMGRRPDGELVRVFFQWQPPTDEQGAEPPPRRKERVEWFLEDVETGKPLPSANFAFIGSLWLKGGFAADLDGTVIALYEDPGTVLELSLERAGAVPWSGVNEDRMPENGTEVEIIIAELEDEDGDEAPDDEQENQEEEATPEEE